MVMMAPCMTSAEGAAMNTRLIDGFTRHHRTLDRAFEDARQATGDGDFVRARAAFQGFRDAIERHMGAEETWLFPAYEARYGNDNALTSILRKGHRDLRGFFEEIAEALDEGDGDEGAALMDTVGQILHHHDEKEEQEFYPAVATLVDDPTPALTALES